MQLAPPPLSHQDSIVASGGGGGIVGALHGRRQNLSKDNFEIHFSLSSR